MSDANSNDYRDETSDDRAVEPAYEDAASDGTFVHVESTDATDDFPY